MQKQVIWEATYHSREGSCSQRVCSRSAGRLGRGEVSIISDIDLQTCICFPNRNIDSVLVILEFVYEVVSFIIWVFMLLSITNVYEGHEQK
jgi:hypothetical protein